MFFLVAIPKVSLLVLLPVAVVSKLAGLVLKLRVLVLELRGAILKRSGTLFELKKTYVFYEFRYWNSKKRY